MMAEQLKLKKKKNVTEFSSNGQECMFICTLVDNKYGQTQPCVTFLNDIFNPMAWFVHI